MILEQSSPVDTCKRVCLFLGPYRNLTTLTAATLFLHPKCQVLNHAGARIFGTECDFLRDFGSESLDTFIEWSVALSASGRRGDYGGSITYSHAFDDKYVTGRLFRESGQQPVKTQIDAMVWKESHRLSNYIREQDLDIHELVERDNRLCFLMPVRNPMDCAQSNVRTGHYRNFRQLGASPSVSDVLHAVLDEMVWFFSHATTMPDNFFWYFEHTIAADTLADLQRFLRLPHDDEWMEMALEAMAPGSRYSHDEALVDSYHAAVERKFSDLPAIRDQLLMFIESE